MSSQIKCAFTINDRNRRHDKKNYYGQNRITVLLKVYSIEMNEEKIG